MRGVAANDTSRRDVQFVHSIIQSATSKTPTHDSWQNDDRAADKTTRRHRQRTVQLTAICRMYTDEMGVRGAENAGVEKAGKQER